MTRKIIISFCALFIYLWGLAYAAPTMPVHVAVGKVSEVVLPEKVAKVIKGGAVESVLVEVIENSVYVLPKSTTPADIFVTGVSGESYPINLRISPEHDVRVEIKGATVSRISQGSAVNPMALMKDVMRGIEPAGASVLKTPKSLFLAQGQINLTIERVYDYPQVAAYVMRAKNIVDKSIIIPIQQITFPGLLAVSADADLLNPRGEDGDSTAMYMIVGK